MEQLLQAIKTAVSSLGVTDAPVELSRPEDQFGDFSTNVAMRLSKQLGKNPRQIAEEIVANLQSIDGIVSAEVAGPGFINLRVSDGWLLHMINEKPEQTQAGKTVICEYSDMNAFKTAHVGHLYTTLVGNAVANLYEAVGAKVVRANFGGDVGLHVGKAMWAIMRFIDNDPTKLANVPETERSAWVAARYVEGNTAYEENEQSKAEIIDTNKKVYALHESGDRDADFAQVYWTCRTWSYDGFEQFYDQLELDKQPDGTYFVYYPESTTAPFGAELVREGTEKKIFTISDGATVYVGEPEGLHTRVFLTAQGLPTYEAKDLGLAVKKWQDYHFDTSVIITANDISEYMKVILAALNHFYPEITERTRHITHGLVKLSGGQKMSSRKGNVLLPEDVLEAAKLASIEASGKENQQTILGAVKYAFLRTRIGGDIVYDPAESVSVHGNSGPYLQYAHARACSILAKSASSAQQLLGSETGDLEQGERLLVKKLGAYAEVVNEAASELAPHIVCTYLYELAQEFNRFYEGNKVLGNEREALRLSLVAAYRDTLANGLGLLGIHAPEQM